MALSKETKIDKVEIVGDFKHIQVREATVISEDGVELSTSYSRYVVSPGDDVSGQPDDIQQLAQLYHTPDVIAAYQAAISEPA